MTRLVSPIVAFVEWLYGPRAAGVDLALGALSGSWCILMVLRPAQFDTARFAGFVWLSDRAWIAVMGGLTSLHAIGLLRSRWRDLRVAAALGSSWLWMFVAISLARVEISPGVFNYVVVGIGALFAAIFVSLSSDRA